MGGSRHIIHFLKNGETLDSVARDYGIRPELLKQINVSEHQVEVLEDTFDLANLQEGDRLIVILKANGTRQHCDAKKRDQILPVHPLRTDCASHFRYHPLDGRMEELK